METHHNIRILCLKWDTHPYFYLERRFHAVFDYRLTNRSDGTNINIILLFTNKKWIRDISLLLRPKLTRFEPQKEFIAQPSIDKTFDVEDSIPRPHTMVSVYCTNCLTRKMYLEAYRHTIFLCLSSCIVTKDNYNKRKS